MTHKPPVSVTLSDGRGSHPVNRQPSLTANRRGLFLFWRRLWPHRHHWLRQASIDLDHPGSRLVLAVRHCPECGLVEVIE